MSVAKIAAVVFILAMILTFAIWRDRDSAPDDTFTLTSIQSEGDSLVDLQIYSSDSDVYRLSVDPSDRRGRGEATYKFAKNGQVVWTKDLPFTLLDVVITDAGEVVGYSYSNGIEGYGESDGNGDFRVVILDAAGESRLGQTTKREPSRYLHTLPNPVARGMIVDTSNDRVIYRIADPDVNRRSETWWNYRLSTGKLVNRLRPRDRMKQTEHLSYLINACNIEGTSLILTDWWRYQYPDPKGLHSSIIGGRFTLVDVNADPVWELELPRDYVVPARKDAQDQLMSYVQQNGAILSTDGRQFELLFAEAGQRVAFQVTESSDGWNVREVSRSPLAIEELTDQPKVTTSLPKTLLRSLRQIQLDVTKVESPIRNLFDFTFDDRGRIVFIQSEYKQPATFVLIDQQGNVISTVPLQFASDENASWNSCSWIMEDRFLVTRCEYGPEKTSRAWWVDASRQTMSLLEGFQCPPVDRLVRFSDGGFVALATMQYRSTMTDGLYGFDSEGNRTWEIDSNLPEHSGKLFSPEDMTVTANDDVVVLDNIRNTLQLFSSNGRSLRKHSLEDAWGREPNYLSGIEANGEGLVIRDFNGNPPYVVTDSEGRLRSGMTPKLSSGRRIDGIGFAVSPDGSIWVTDGDAIFRLNDEGVVDRTLGKSPESSSLNRIAASHVDSNGQIYLVDERSASVHVFGPTGNPICVCRPKPSDFRGRLYDPSVSVGDTGKIVLAVNDVGRNGRFVEFSPQGQRIRSFGLNFRTDHLYQQPGTKKLIALTYESAVIINDDAEIVQIIARRPDGKWLDMPSRASFAADGSFALLDSRAVSVYSADGSPLHTIYFPAIVGQFPRLAFNHDRIVLVGDGTLIVYNGDGDMIQTSSIQLDDDFLVPHLLPDKDELLLVPSHGTTLHVFKRP